MFNKNRLFWTIKGYTPQKVASELFDDDNLQELLKDAPKIMTISKNNNMFLYYLTLPICFVYIYYKLNTFSKKYGYSMLELVYFNRIKPKFENFINPVHDR